jgi:hypothetical protein
MVKLLELRENLLLLHKALVEHERKKYEGKFGKTSPQAFLQLLMQDASYGWLRSLSQLIVGMDEMLENKKADSSAQFRSLVVYVSRLLRSPDGESRFSRKYAEAVKNDPAVALAHGKVVQVLRTLQ